MLSRGEIRNGYLGDTSSSGSEVWALGPDVTTSIKSDLLCTLFKKRISSKHSGRTLGSLKFMVRTKFYIYSLCY